MVGLNNKVLIKKVMSIIFILAICINNFAAIVSDNDGSVFITKGEFEALKMNFDEQIDSYNTSIDSKIDGAIASYLAGVKLASIEYKRSSLEAAGQTYLGVSRKSYVFCGNNSRYFMSRYNNDSNQFTKNNWLSFDYIPQLDFGFKFEAWFNTYSNNAISNGGAELWGADQARVILNFGYIQMDNNGIAYPIANSTIFVVDEDNYVVTYKVDAALRGYIRHIAQDDWNTNDIMARPFFADASHRWLFTFKDVVGAGGTNGMGYSTRALGSNTAVAGTLYRYRLYANTTTAKSGYTYTGKTFQSRGGTTYYIMCSGTNTEPGTVNVSDFDNYPLYNNWFDNHLHFEESRFGESYAWCMPFGHLLPDRKAACFGQWPAWNNVIWETIDTKNVGSVWGTSDRRFTDTTGNYTWCLQDRNCAMNFHNALSRNFYGAYNTSDTENYVDFDGMLPVWKENPMKDWRLLKNRNIKNALGVEAYYAAAPPLTEEFSVPGTITWVAKINQQDVQRIPGRNWANWGNNRIYFTSAPMNDIEYSGTNVKVSNTKKFQYKKHGTTDAWADCESQVLDGKTYYYQTMDHDTYYDFKMDVAAKETVYYMIFDEKQPDDYCLEVIEHPDYQIEFVSE